MIVGRLCAASEFHANGTTDCYRLPALDDNTPVIYTILYGTIDDYF